MQTKWYVSALILILAFLGFSQDQMEVPNQEIVVQFTDNEVTSDAAQQAIASVKKQLQDIGVASIRVQRTADGNLRISYFSSIAIAEVKEVLSEDYLLAAGGEGHKLPSDLPASDLTNRYKLNVLEIQQNFDADSDFNGLLVEALADHERLIHPKVYHSATVVADATRNIGFNVAYKLQHTISVALDTNSFTFPEVRAGPLA